MFDYILFAPTFVLVGGAIMLVLADLLPYPKTKGWIATGAIGLALASVLLLLRHSWPIERDLFVWQPASDGLAPVVFTYYFDAITFLVLVCCLFAAVGLSLYATRYMADEPRHQLIFYFAILLTSAAFVNFVLAGNLVVAYIGLQIWVIASFATIAFWHHGIATTPATIRSFILASLPSTGVLIAALNLSNYNLTLAFSDMKPESVAPPVLFLFLISAAAISYQYPFHPWTAINFRLPLPSAALLGMVFAPWSGVYLLSRFHALSGPQIGVLWHESLIVVGALTMVAGAVYTLKQTHLKGIAIFVASTQFGYAFLGLGIDTPESIAAAFLTLVSGTLALCGMMICIGMIERATGTGSVLKLGGLANRMPRTALLFSFFSLALAGIPFPTIGFFAKWVILGAAFDAGHASFGILTLVVDVLVFVMLIRTIDWVFFRRRFSKSLESGEHGRVSLTSAGSLAFPILFFGVLPFLLLDWFVKPAVSLMVHVPASSLKMSLAGGFSSAGFFTSAVTFLLMLVPPVLGLIAYMVAWGNSESQRMRRGPFAPGQNDGLHESPSVEKRVALFPWVINTSGMHSAGWQAISGIAQGLWRALSPWEANYSPMAILLAALTVLLAFLE